MTCISNSLLIFLLRSYHYKGRWKKQKTPCEQLNDNWEEIYIYYILSVCQMPHISLLMFQTNP